MLKKEDAVKYVFLPLVCFFVTTLLSINVYFIQRFVTQMDSSVAQTQDTRERVIAMEEKVDGVQSLLERILGKVFSINDFSKEERHGQRVQKRR